METSCSKSTRQFLDEECYGKVLEAAASHGDIELMETVLGLQSSPLSEAQKILTLKTLAKNVGTAENAKIPSELLDLAVSTIEDVLMTTRKKDIDCVFLSKVICSLDSEEKIMSIVGSLYGV